MCVRKVYDLETLSRGAKRRRKRVVLMVEIWNLLTKNLRYETRRIKTKSRRTSHF